MDCNIVIVIAHDEDTNIAIVIVIAHNLDGSYSYCT